MLPQNKSTGFPNTSNFQNKPVSTFPVSSSITGQSTFPVSSSITGQSTFPVSSSITGQSTFPVSSSITGQSIFPVSQSIFNQSTFPTISINNEFNIYTEIETCFTNIKTLSIFTNSQEMTTSDFNVINVVSLDCLEKLGNLSTIYIKKINECNLVNTKLNTMHDKHLELITKIIKFNNIYNEVSINLKHLSSLELSPEQKQFTFDEIFYRYKLQICEIISNIKIINTYKTILN